MRHFTWQPRRCFHRFQWLYWPLSLCLVLLQVAITDVTGFFLKGRMGALTASSWTCRELMIFGTNTQTEHHLFPTVPFRYLPDITPIIQAVSEKHNVNFRKPYDGFLTVFKLYLDRIVYLSKPES